MKSGKIMYIGGIIAILAALAVIISLPFGSFNALQVAYATSYNGVVTGSLTVGATCAISLSSSTLDFGTLAPQGNTITNAIITDTNSGTATANLLVSGTDWTSGSNTIGVSNTLWDGTVQTSYTGTALTSTATDTGLTVAPNSGTQAIYFGVGIPSNALAGSYTETITLENSC